MWILMGMKAIATIYAMVIIIMALETAIVAEYCTLWYYKYLCGKE